MEVGVDDLRVADSEGEDAYTQLPPENGSRVSPATPPAAASNVSFTDVPVIQATEFIPDQPCTPPRGFQSPSTFAGGSLFTPPGETDLPIGNSTSVLPTSGAPLEMAPKSRPRPRVVVKKAATSNHNTDVANTSFPHISGPPTSTAGRTNGSIHPATATSFGLFDVVDDAFSSFDIAERAKMRSRKSQVAKRLVHPPAQMNEIIELTSDEDELTLKPAKRQRKQGASVQKPKAQTKPRPRPTQNVRPEAALSSSSPPTRAVLQDPPASDAQYALSSQQPASTLPTVPPPTPPQARELTPLSSPPVTSRKRRRVRPSIAEDDDEMDIIGGNPIEVSPSSTMPPLFFAPSSSSMPTDSGVEIPQVESLGGRGKKKQMPGKKGTRKKAQNKGRKGRKGNMIGAADEVAEGSTGVTQEPSTPAMRRTPSFEKEHHSPTVNNPTATEKASGRQTATKGKARTVVSSEEENESVLPSDTGRTPLAGEGEGRKSKKNSLSDDLDVPKRDPPPNHTPTLQVRRSSVKPKLTPMSELIRRVNSQPSSPFPNASRTYTPLLKSSRTMLSRIAPLHPNRRTPPPPLPRPPPPKKSKKQLAMEERIDEELAETVDGWSCLTDDERKALRKARIDAELGYGE